MSAYPIRFCVTCKKMADARIVNNVDMFTAFGHTAGPVKRLQRNVGRRQRAAEWQRLP